MLAHAFLARLFTALVVQTTETVAHVLHWSQWRRRHQATARASHYRRRRVLREVGAASRPRPGWALRLIVGLPGSAGGDAVSGERDQVGVPPLRPVVPARS
ncbi:hypothetical protein FRAHR75_410015 [Frankia sp. Hr75.2]|nr:hypothetical protein FRAHR75_410015 [Frankia sp. Hr75.2]